MKVMNHTEEQQTENKTSLSNGAKKKSDFHIYSNSRCDSSSDNCCFYWLLFSSGAYRREETGRIIKSREAKKQNEKKLKQRKQPNRS